MFFLSLSFVAIQFAWLIVACILQMTHDLKLVPSSVSAAESIASATTTAATEPSHRVCTPCCVFSCPVRVGVGLIGCVLYAAGIHAPRDPTQALYTPHHGCIGDVFILLVGIDPSLVPVQHVFC